MKIEKEIPSGGASPAARSAEVHSNQRASRYRQAESAPSTATDHVQLSGIAHSIMTVDAAQAAERTARIQALSKSFQAGRLTIEPRQLSRKIIDTWLTGGAAPKE